MQRKDDSRVLYLDYLRIISIIAVVILHVAGQKWHGVDFRSYQWQVFNIIDCAVRWSVPIFVMISGTLFLDNNRNIKTKTLYSKNILRIVVATIFWSIVYIFNEGITGMTKIQILSSFIEGNFHMWYLYMIIGLYIAVPVLRKITLSKKTTEYFLIVGTVITFIIPRTTEFLKLLNIPSVTAIAKSINEVTSDMNFHLTLGYVFYFVLGYYLATYDISVNTQRIIYTYGPISYVVTVVLSKWHSNQIGKASSYFYSDMSINVLLMTVCVFVFGKYVLSKINLSDKTLKIVLHLSKCSFGIYLVHVLIMDQLNKRLNFNTMSYSPILSVILVTTVVFILAYAVSAILNRIPVLKKYIV